MERGKIMHYVLRYAEKEMPKLCTNNPRPAVMTRSPWTIGSQPQFERS